MENSPKAANFAAELSTEMWIGHRKSKLSSAAVAVVLSLPVMQTAASRSTRFYGFRTKAP